MSKIRHTGILTDKRGFRNSFRIITDYGAKIKLMILLTFGLTGSLYIE